MNGRCRWDPCGASAAEGERVLAHLADDLGTLKERFLDANLTT